ncbi:MAG TPA: hypothetical protein VF786_03940 [Terriglobales bacterium]
MEATLAVDRAHKVIFIHFQETLTNEVFLRAYGKARNWIAAHGYASQITDFTDVTSFQVTSNAIRELAESAPLAPDEYLRVVVAPQQVAFGITRMFEIMGSGTRDRVHIVETVEQAYGLLGTDQSQFQPIDPQ